MSSIMASVVPSGDGRMCMVTLAVASIATAALTYRVARTMNISSLPLLGPVLGGGMIKNATTGGSRRWGGSSASSASQEEEAEEAEEAVGAMGGAAAGVLLPLLLLEGGAAASAALEATAGAKSVMT
mmetsp:Transcript_24983/g.61586  ORF Transcript_24983/g.61586 Transcript_24983/m.61586 type:complete len:127 (-) Transcript_24983:308-688(-)